MRLKFNKTLELFYTESAKFIELVIRNNSISSNATIIKIPIDSANDFLEIVNDHKKSRETRKKYFDVNDNFKLLYDLEFPDLIKFNATIPRTNDSNISMTVFHHFSLKKFEKFMKSVNDSIEIAKGIPAKLKKEISENDEKIKKLAKLKYLDVNNGLLMGCEYLYIRYNPYIVREEDDINDIDIFSHNPKDKCNPLHSTLNMDNLLIIAEGAIALRDNYRKKQKLTVIDYYNN